MMKIWKYQCNVPIKSLAIELLSKDFLSTWQYYDKSAVYYDWMVRDFLEYIITRTSHFSYMPLTYEVIYLGELWKTYAQTAYLRACKACTYEYEKKDLEATLEWQKIFGYMFQG